MPRLGGVEYTNEQLGKLLAVELEAIPRSENRIDELRFERWMVERIDAVEFDSEDERRLLVRAFVKACPTKRPKRCNKCGTCGWCKYNAQRAAYGQAWQAWKASDRGEAATALLSEAFDNMAKALREVEP